MPALELQRQRGELGHHIADRRFRVSAEAYSIAGRAVRAGRLTKASGRLNSAGQRIGIPVQSLGIVTVTACLEAVLLKS